jgi:hypothetical protein
LHSSTAAAEAAAATALHATPAEAATAAAATPSAALGERPEVRQKEHEEQNRECDEFEAHGA